MPLAYWILNYKNYDPSYNSDNWAFIFRNNILNVTDDFIVNYLNATEEFKISIEDVKEKKNIKPTILLFLIDFDAKLFVNYFNDVSVEEYLPDEKWQGIFDSPLKFI